MTNKFACCACVSAVLPDWRRRVLPLLSDQFQGDEHQAVSGVTPLIALIRKYPYFLGVMALVILVFTAEVNVSRWQPAFLTQSDVRQSSPDLTTTDRAATGLPTMSKTEAANHQEGREPLLTIDSASSYEDLKAQLEPLADTDYPVALRTLAQIYEYCANYAVSPEMFHQAREAMSELVPENAEAYMRIAKTVDTRCSRLDGGDPIPMELRQLSLMQAAEAGDTYSRIKLAVMSGDNVSPGEIDAMVDDALMGGDPQAILALGDLMAMPGAGEKYAEFSGTGAQFAWMVFACRNGPPGLCDRNSHLMTNLCLYQGTCRYQNLEEYVRTEVFTGEQSGKLDQIIRQIQDRSQIAY